MGKHKYRVLLLSFIQNHCNLFSKKKAFRVGFHPEETGFLWKKPISSGLPDETVRNGFLQSISDVEGN